MAEFLNYKGRPLVRCGDTLYYGNMEDKAVVQLTVKDKEKDGDITTAKKIQVVLLDTDTSLEKFAGEFLVWGFTNYLPMFTGQLNRHPREAMSFTDKNRTDYTEFYKDLLDNY